MKTWLRGFGWLCLPLVFVAFNSARGQEINVPHGSTPTIDGTISSGEYSDAVSLTFSTQGGTATVYLKVDGSNLYVAFDLPNAESGSSAQIFFDTACDRAGAPQTDDYRLTDRVDAGPFENQGTGSGWTAPTSPSGWSSAKTTGTSTWQVEFSISYGKLGITAGVGDVLGISFWNAWTSSGDHRWPSAADWVTPSTWGKMYLDIINVPYGSTPTIDGTISSGEYSDATSLTFSTQGGTATVYLKVDGNNLYVAFDLPNADAGSAAQIFFDTALDRAGAPQTDDYRLTDRVDSGPFENQGTGSGWTAGTSPSGWSSAKATGTSTWQAEFSVSYSKLGITAGVADTLGVSFWNAWTSSGDHRWPSAADWVTPSTWGKLYSSDNFVPIELSSLEAISRANEVVLVWSTASESDNYGFNIERKNPGSDFAKIGFVSGKGTTVLPQKYTFIDKNVSPGLYYYRLKQIDFDGVYTYSKAVRVQVKGPASFSLSQNYPNPFNAKTRISYQLPKKAHVQIKIYNTLGKEIKTIEDIEKEAGSYSVIWDGKNHLGKDVASGIYIYLIQAGKFHTESRKMLLIR